MAEIIVYGTKVVTNTKGSIYIPTPPAVPTTIELVGASEAVEGGSVTLLVTVFDQYGQVMSNQPISWGSTNTAVAAVSETGVVTCVGEGTATITAATGEIITTHVINVAAYSPFVFDAASNTITGYAVNGPRDVVIPAMINGVPVRHIGLLAFSDTGLTSLSLPEGLLTIGPSAFSQNIGITNISIPSTVTHIGSSAFNVSKVAVPTTLSLPVGVVIGSYAFVGRPMHPLTIPDKVDARADSALSGHLTVTPPQVINIGNKVLLLDGTTGISIETYMYEDFYNKYKTYGGGTYRLNTDGPLFWEKIA